MFVRWERITQLTLARIQPSIRPRAGSQRSVGPYPVQVGSPDQGRGPFQHQIYAVPIEHAPLTGVTLRVTPPANNQTLRIRMARDYLLDVAIATTLRPAAPRLA